MKHYLIFCLVAVSLAACKNENQPDKNLTKYMKDHYSKSDNDREFLVSPPINNPEKAIDNKQ